MNLPLAFIRSLYMILSLFFMATYRLSQNPATPITSLLLGGCIGLAFGSLLIGFDIAFRKFNLRSFNISILGLFIGFVMGKALVLVFDEVASIGGIDKLLHGNTIEAIKIGLFLFSTYLGTLMTLRAADELYVSIPFIRFAPTTHKKKDLLVDGYALSDPRIYDLCATGILDHQLIIPQFIVKELYAQSEVSDENIKTRAKKSLENLKKLQSLETLALRYNETDSAEVRDPQNKMQRLARLLNANILSADVSRIQINMIDGVKIINLNTLSLALKPLRLAGEILRIQIQRVGKEPRQGVGYLEDGTMVVVNGGGHYLGENIEARVLSVKHTTSGRMIFCNAVDDELSEKEMAEEVLDEHR